MKTTPDTLTKKQKDFIEALRASAGIFTTACKKSQTARTTAYYWLKENEQFAEQCQIIKDEMLDFAESCLLKELKNGNITAIIFYLKCQGKARGWTDAPQTAIQNNNIQQVNFNVIFDE